MLYTSIMRDFVMFIQELHRNSLLMTLNVKTRPAHKGTNFSLIITRLCARFNLTKKRALIIDSRQKWKEGERARKKSVQFLM